MIRIRQRMRCGGLSLWWEKSVEWDFFWVSLHADAREKLFVVRLCVGYPERIRRKMIRFLLLILFAFPALADPSVSVAFSPRGGGTEAVVQVISEAKQSIHVAAYGFTSKPIADALIRASRRGVSVEVVLDKSNVKARYSEAGELVGAGVPVRVDYQYSIMHDKYLINDGKTVETGSFNLTSAAEKSNAENVLILRDYPTIAAQYDDNWKKLWNESQEFGK